MTNFSLQQKILFPILGAFALVIGIGSWYFVSKQFRETESWYREELSMLAVSSGYMGHGTAEELIRAKGLRFHKIALREGFGAGGKNEIEKRAVAAFSRNADLKLFVDEVPVGDATYLTVFAATKYGQECMACHSGQANNLFTDNSRETQRALFGVSGSMAELNIKEATTQQIALIVTAIIIIGLGWLVHRYMNMMLLEPMRELKYQTEIVANCDLRTVKTPALERKLKSWDEMGHVTRSFATMIHVLRKTARRMQDASFEVADASNQISSSVEKMSIGAQGQMSQAGEVEQAIEEMTKTIMENAKKTGETVETALKARFTAEAGGKIVSATAKGMKRIEEVNSKSSQTVQALERSSQKIGEIVKLINDIADQTNLLALNAATEAARAGDKGKGFEIVAEEVRRLAERTMKATKEIADMIQLIQNGTIEAVKSMDEGTVEVSEGIKLATQAGQSLQEIVTISQKVADMIRQIAEANEQQARTSEHITKKIQLISSAADQMAHGTIEVAQAAEGLNNLTERLEEVVNEFKLDETDHATD